MVILSAYIRLAEVGIGCEPWPDCYAVLHPETERKGITVLTDQGSDMGHRGARLAHRYIASTLGLFIIVLFFQTLLRNESRGTGLGVPIAILLITIFLSLLGYYTPSRDVPLITMGNLLGGMAMLGLLWWLMQRNTEIVEPGETSQLRGLALLALGLVIVQITLGGWSSANYASVACPDLLGCDSPWLGTAQYGDAYTLTREVKLQANGQVIREASLGALSMSHRAFALLTAAYLAWLVRKLRPRPELKNTALAMSLFSISLIIAGVSMVWFEMPLLLASLHNGLAAGLLICSVQLLHRLTPQSTAPL
jgi:cytochrome c oxidase assembly protein subunit 15